MCSLKGRCNFAISISVVRLGQMCAMCAGRNFQKCEARAFSFFFFVSRPFLYPVALLVKSSQSGRKVGLCCDMSVVTRHCQCVRCLFSMCPDFWTFKRVLSWYSVVSVSVRVNRGGISPSSLTLPFGQNHPVGMWLFNAKSNAIWSTPVCPPDIIFKLDRQ